MTNGSASSAHLINGVEPITGEAEIQNCLEPFGVGFRTWCSNRQQLREATQETVLEQFRGEIDHERTQGGYSAFDSVSLTEESSREFGYGILHYHEEDEVRMVVNGSGVFFISGQNDQIVAVYLCGGDMIRIPRLTPHYFSLGFEKRVLAIRLFQQEAGWKAHFLK